MTGTDEGRDATAIPGSSAATPLLDPDEPAAFEIVNPDGDGHAVLVCDHASARLPRCLGNLGLGSADRQSHIAWDPGAGDVARRLSAQLDAPLILSGYSRLAIDCNRPLASPESIPATSGGIRIPGNENLTRQERVRRIETLFQPYHRAIRGVLDRRVGRPGLLLSLHSFTPVLDGKRRPWDIGFTHGRDRRLAALFIAAMAQESGLVVGDNEPYAVDAAFDYTIPVHGEARGLSHVLIEIRQDGLATVADVDRWATRLAAAFGRIEAAATGIR